jgi:hypothetical protein
MRIRNSRRSDSTPLVAGNGLIACPLGTGDEAMDSLHVGGHWIFVVKLRAVAAAFDEVDARHHWITRQGLEGEDQRLLHQAMDH